MNVWSARTGASADAAFQTFSSSIVEDAAFLHHDVIGSIAHVRGLEHAGLLRTSEADALASALRQILAEAQAGSFQLDPALEDVHMNIEATLTARLGDTGRKLHTGRSRNDQVATCIVLHARDRLVAIGHAAHGVAGALLAQAAQHTKTPWVARTHGQPAQPATLAFLLLAHAYRFQDAASKAIATFHEIGESPLGSGAVAGSTLPLDPEYTAGLLGLRPPRNALLATGSRDHVLATLDATSKVAAATSSLAEDLFELTTRNAFHLPTGLSTGSSLMPQKRNPDAIELVRGHARALIGHELAVQNVCLPLGLGYVRDLQVVKPHLVQATTHALGMLQILTACIKQGEFDVDVLSADLDAPGIGATDAAEALVAAGIPFRSAYDIVAKAYAHSDPVQAIQESGLPPAAIAAAIGALAPDASRRATIGGPAPITTMESLRVAGRTQGELDSALEAAATQAAKASTLLAPEVQA